MEALFIVFRITPYSRNIALSLLKEPKIYFFDTGLVKGDEGKIFENHVAVSLLKDIYAKADYFGEERTLHYLKTKEVYEVDFAIARDENIEKIIEIKLSDGSISQRLSYFSQKYGFPAIQLVRYLRNETQYNGIQVLKAENFLSDLFL